MDDMHDKYLIPQDSVLSPLPFSLLNNGLNFQFKTISIIWIKNWNMKISKIPGILLERFNVVVKHVQVNNFCR